LHYLFTAKDAEGNTRSTDQVDVLVSDNDVPALDTDTSDTAGTTGGSFTFRITATDNIGVASIIVEYWFGSDTHLTAGVPGSLTLTLSLNHVVMHYFFNITDAASNWVTGPERMVTIVDNDDPVFGTDMSDADATTGDGFTVRMTVSDNIGVVSANLTYWFGTGSTTTVPFSVSYAIPVPVSSLEPLHYSFSAADAEGNSETTSIFNRAIVDNDAPVLGADTSDVAGTTGGPFTFRISATDNIAVSSIEVEYWYGTGSHLRATILGSLNITLDLNHVTMHYFFNASDGAGNWIAGSEVMVAITDDDAPVFGKDTSDTIGIAGSTITFRITVTDNIDVAAISLVYWFGTGSVHVVQFNGSRALALERHVATVLYYYFNATDLEGNMARTPTDSIQIRDKEAEDLALGGTIASIAACIAGVAIVAAIAIRKKKGVISKTKRGGRRKGKGDVDLLPREDTPRPLAPSLKDDHPASNSDYPAPTKDSSAPKDDRSDLLLDL